MFDHYKALGHIQTGYTIMFAVCVVAYLIAWVVMKSLVPKYKPITELIIFNLGQLAGSIGLLSLLLKF